MNDMRFVTLRKAMVDSQIRPNKVIDDQVIEAFSTVPRELFVNRTRTSSALPKPEPRQTLTCSQAICFHCRTYGSSPRSDLGRGTLGIIRAHSGSLGRTREH